MYAYSVSFIYECICIILHRKCLHWVHLGVWGGVGAQMDICPPCNILPPPPLHRTLEIYQALRHLHPANLTPSLKKFQNAALLHTPSWNIIGTCVILHSTICLRLLYSIMSTGDSDSDSVVSPPVTCVDTVTVHLRSQCSGGCSDVQETAEVQS